MALNLRTLKIIEDIDPTTMGPRLRLEVQELKPRKHMVNLKNMSAEQINLIMSNVGSIMSFPSAREMIYNGMFMVSFAASTDDIFILAPAEPIAVAAVVDLPISSVEPIAVAAVDTDANTTQVLKPKFADLNKRAGQS